MKISIPTDFIEEADEYAIIPSDYPGMHVPIGGKIMLNFVVREQMDIDMILATTGTSIHEGHENDKELPHTTCLILVGYKLEVVKEMIKIARERVDKLIETGLLDPKSGL